MGQFIISFDCEGKWGMADKLTHFHDQVLTNKNLINTYKKIIDLLDKYEIAATFAFVGAFTLSVDEYQTFQHRITAPVINGKPWLSNFLKEIKAGHFEGWLAPECFNMVKQETAHEIASHGFTHVPLQEKTITRDDFKYEMQLIQDFIVPKSSQDMTFIYPRNQIGYVDELANAGFIGFRDDLKKPDGIMAIAREFNIWGNVSSQQIVGYPTVIPAGYFLNCRSGVRAFIPQKVTVQRWKNMIMNAIMHNKVLHLWSHPHNFITGRDMFNLFESILKVVSFMQKRGELKVMTQKDYCQNIQYIMRVARKVS